MDTESKDFENTYRSMYRKAINFASCIHYDQLYGEHPYIKHLNDVEDVLIRFGFESSFCLRICAWLHDSIEDIDSIDFNIIKSMFGERVAIIVGAVTDPNGINRKERKRKLYERFNEDFPFREDAIRVKLADRIANIESCIFDNNHSLLRMYFKEHNSFVSNLHKRISEYQFSQYVINTEEMWNHLETLII